MLGSYDGRVRFFEPDLLLVCLSYQGFFQLSGELRRPDKLADEWTDVSYWREQSYLFTVGRKLVGWISGDSPLGVTWERRLQDLLSAREPQSGASRRERRSNADRMAGFVAARAEEGVAVALLLLPTAAQNDPGFSAKVRAWSEQAPHRIVFDAIDAIKAHPGWNEGVSFVDAHPSVRAHEIFAQEFGAQLEAYLANTDALYASGGGGAHLRLSQEAMLAAGSSRSLGR